MGKNYKRRDEESFKIPEHRISWLNLPWYQVYDIIHKLPLNAGQKDLLFHIYRRTNKDRENVRYGTSWTSQENMAEPLSCDERTVRRNFAELRDEGYIEVRVNESEKSRLQKGLTGKAHYNQCNLTRKVFAEAQDIMSSAKPGNAKMMPDAEDNFARAEDKNAPSTGHYVRELRALCPPSIGSEVVKEVQKEGSSERRSLAASNATTLAALAEANPAGQLQPCQTQQPREVTPPTTAPLSSYPFLSRYLPWVRSLSLDFRVKLESRLSEVAAKGKDPESWFLRTMGTPPLRESWENYRRPMESDDDKPVTVGFKTYED